MKQFFRRPERLLMVAAGAFLCATSLAAIVRATGGEESPTVPVVQRAYDREAKTGNARHDANLRIVEAKCKRNQPHVFGCFISFTDRLDPDERLYFDVAELSDRQGVWQLTSGICKR
jgi:hypothetical protein